MVNDFIDMRKEKHRRIVERTLRDAVRRDRARTKVFPISKLGLIEMSRQRVRPSLLSQLSDDCPYCTGTGKVLSMETMSNRIERLVRSHLSLSGPLAFTTSALIAYTKNFRAGEVAKEHQAAAQRMWLIRERYLSLISDLEAESGSLESARERRDALQTELSNVYEQAPRTSASAYLAAQQALQVNDELTFTDAEIDKFLPALLRKAGNPAPTTADGQDSTGEGT